MLKKHTSFLSQIHGFSFHNVFNLNLPVKFKLPFGGEINLNDVTLGLCGGMCFTALDYFLSGLPRPDFSNPNQIDKKTLSYLCQRQIDSLKLPVVIKFLEWMLLEENTLAVRMARYEVPRIRKNLDNDQPVVLGLVRVRGLGNPTLNHQVIATGYEFNPTTKDLLLQIYDPNYPLKDVDIRINLAHPSSGINLTQSSGERLRGFFVLPYKVHKMKPQPSVAVEALSFGALSFDTPTFKLYWPVDSRRVNQYFGENPNSYKPFGLAGHEGLDLFALTGANIYSCADGEVYQTGFPKNHPYGYHIRVKHVWNGKTYHTIYSHLSEILVKVGQKVSAGEKIGLADNTGNSFGSHLHLTLKIDGEKTPGYPSGIVDPWPFLRDSMTEKPKPSAPILPSSGVLVFTTADLRLRTGPDQNADLIAILPAGEPLDTRGNAAEIRSKIGIQGEWLQVQTASGQAGYVAAWFVQDSEQIFPPSDLVLYPFDSVNLRSGPGTNFDLLVSMKMDDPLTVLGDPDLAVSKLGKKNEWLHVQTDKGQRGFVAAWLVHKTGQAAPQSGLVVYSTTILNVRARPTTEGNILTKTSPGEKLTVLGSKDQSEAKIGQQDAWLNIKTLTGFSGFVAAWLVTAAAPLPNTPQPIADTLKVFPTTDINMRAQPSINSPRIGGATRNDPLFVIDTDLQEAKSKIGQNDAWVYVEKQNGERGWVAAWLLRHI
jgi:murein DD-endopeptidase MepM/ murein hydrolase activator NlpD/uncharacterized protein YgiM (DUF1202 family)